MPKDREVPLTFPVNGIDVTREFQLQPNGTTPDAVNVRSQDAIARRNRGGSRPGFSKYVAQQIPEGAVLVQHLNVIVDPTTAALPQNFLTPGDDWVEDPRTGNMIPPGGAAWQPNPNTLPPPDEDDIQYIQKQTGSGVRSTLVGATLVLTLPSAVAEDDLIVLFVVTSQSSILGTPGSPGTGVGDTNVTVIPVDGNSAAYTQVGTYIEADNEAFVTAQTSEAAAYYRMSAWRKVADATGGGTVVIPIANEPSSPDDVTIRATALVYRNVDDAAPVDDADNDTDESATPSITTLTTGAVTVSDEGALVAAVFADTTGLTGLCDFVEFVFDYAPGFAGLESDPGITTGSVCECNPEDKTDWINLELNAEQLGSISTMNQLLFEQGYIGEGVDAIDSITANPTIAFGCSGPEGGGFESPSSTSPSMTLRDNNGNIIRSYDSFPRPAGTPTFSVTLAAGAVVAICIALSLKKE